MANSFPVSLIFPEKEVVMWLQSAAEVYPLLWLATRGDKIVLLNDRSWSPVVFHNEIVFFSHENNPLSTKLVKSRCLDIGLVHFLLLLWTSSPSRSMRTPMNKINHFILVPECLALLYLLGTQNLINIQPSWPRGLVNGPHLFNTLVFNRRSWSCVVELIAIIVSITFLNYWRMKNNSSKNAKELESSYKIIGYLKMKLLNWVIF